MRTFSVLALVAAGAGCAFSSPEASSRGQARPRPLSRAGAGEGSKAGCLARTKKVTLTIVMMVMVMTLLQMMQVLLGRELAASPRLGPYAVFTVADFLAFCAIYIPYTHLPPLAVAHGVTPAKVSIISTHYLSTRYQNTINAISTH